MNPRVKNVKALENHLLEIRFTDNSRRIFNMKPYLHFGVFEELQNMEYFSKVYKMGNSIAWPNGQDICPDTLFMESKPLKKIFYKQKSKK